MISMKKHNKKRRKEAETRLVLEAGAGGWGRG